MEFEFLPPLDPPPEVRESLELFKSWGCIVEHYLFDSRGEIDREAHFRAAVSGLEALRKDTYHWYSRDRWTINWEVVGRERGRPWSAQEFFGPWYDPLARHLFPGAVDETVGSLIADLTVLSDLEWDDLHEFIGYSNYTTRGYAQAALNPPYSLVIPHGKKWKLVPTRTVAEAFGVLRPALFGNGASIEVVNWPLDFSDFFIPGQLWWGSYFWTVWVPERNWIVTVMVSGTD